MNVKHEWVQTDTDEGYCDWCGVSVHDVEDTQERCPRRWEMYALSMMPDSPYWI